MKVYVAMGGIDFEGFRHHTMRVFNTRQDADVYSYLLTTEGLFYENGSSELFNFSRVFEKEVE